VTAIRTGRAAAAGTRERLLAAARAVVEQDGYAAATVLAVAERAGVAAGTLYRHFPAKEALFVELFHEVGRGEERAMRAAAAGLGAGASPVDTLEEVLATFARRALRNPRLAWALLAEPVDPLVDAERLAYRARYVGLVAEALRDALAAGEIAALDVDFTAAAIVGGCGEALVGPLAPGAGTDAGVGAGRRPWRGAERIEAELRAFVRRAVGAPPRDG
jgi:AcrR family transcriptional regulator